MMEKTIVYQTIQKEISQQTHLQHVGENNHVLLKSHAPTIEPLKICITVSV